MLWDIILGHYIAKPFNFFVSPVIDPMFGMDRSFLCQASAIDMLCREGFDLNHLLRHGIRYLSKDEEKEIREKEIEMTNGVRDQILIDEGGETFLSQCRSRPSPLVLYPSYGLSLVWVLITGMRSKNGLTTAAKKNTISSTSLFHHHTINVSCINPSRPCSPIS